MKYLGAPQSGSQANTTASHNRAGQYYRNRRSPVQPVGTGRRAIARSNFGASSAAWAALTFSEQQAWAAYADSHPITDSLGSSIKLTGHQMFVGINASLQNASQPISTVPPISSDVFNFVDPIVQVTDTGFVLATTGATGTVDDFILYAMSQPKSGGITFNKTFNQLAVGPGNEPQPFDLGPAYVAQFGMPPLGSRVFFRLTPVNQYGVKGVEVIAFATVFTAGVAAVVTAGMAGIITWVNPVSVPDFWQVEESSDGGLTWQWVQQVSGVTLTAVGLTSGNLARIYGVNADGSVNNDPSNAVLVV